MTWILLPSLVLERPEVGSEPDLRVLRDCPQYYKPVLRVICWYRLGGTGDRDTVRPVVGVGGQTSGGRRRSRTRDCVSWSAEERPGSPHPDPPTTRAASVDR